MKEVNAAKFVENLFSALRNAFLACFGSYALVQSVRELMILHKHFSTSLDHN